MEEAISKPLFTRRELTRLIWPLIIEQTLFITVGLADSIMVSSVGEAAVSGVSLVDMISILLINIFAAMATGGAVVVSQFVGARDKVLARRACDQLVICTFVAALLITGLLLAFREPVLRLAFGRVEPDVMDNCMTYVTITALAYPCMSLYNAGAAIFRAQGNSRVSMKVSLLMNAVNVAGNAILVYGVGMGVAGVAIPTVVSRTVAAAVILGLLWKKDAALRLSAPWKMRPNRALIYRVLTIGIPNAVENSMFQFGKIITISMITAFGTAQISANAMSNNISAVSILMGQALSLAIVTVVGQCVGAQDLRQARRYGLQISGLGTALNTAACVLVLALLPALTRLYNASPETAGYIRRLVTLNCVCVPVFWSTSFILPGALRAANDVKYTSIVAVFSMWVFRIGFSYLLGVYWGWGVLGVWSAMILDWVVRSAFYLPRFLSGGWKKHATYKNLR